MEINVGTETTFEERQAQLKEEKKREEEKRKKDKKSPYKNFTQVNKDFWKAEDWLMAKSPIAYRIFKFLVTNMDEYNAVICSYKVLQETFSISRATVTRAVKLLKEKGYIAVFKTGTSNVYALNHQIVWNSWGTNYQYSKFPANVILSVSEQENQTKIRASKHKILEKEKESINQSIKENLSKKVKDDGLIDSKNHSFLEKLQNSTGATNEQIKKAITRLDNQEKAGQNIRNFRSYLTKTVQSVQEEDRIRQLVNRSGSDIEPDKHKKIFNALLMS